jgi:hypothetical protein
VDFFQVPAAGGPSASLPAAAGFDPAPDDTAMPSLDGQSVSAVALSHLLLSTSLFNWFADPQVSIAPPKANSVSLTTAADFAAPAIGGASCRTAGATAVRELRPRGMRQPS